MHKLKSSIKYPFVVDSLKAYGIVKMTLADFMNYIEERISILPNIQSVIFSIYFIHTNGVTTFKELPLKIENFNQKNILTKKGVLKYIENSLTDSILNLPNTITNITTVFIFEFREPRTRSTKKLYSLL